jgi:hypothetical protein
VDWVLKSIKKIGAKMKDPTPKWIPRLMAGNNLNVQKG